MSPSRERGGSGRPSPLRIHWDSYLIRKAHSPPPSWTSSSAPSSSNSAAPSGGNSHHSPPPHQQEQHQRHPVIIYTHSPKVIHTQPRDFMALVQKLTGLSRSKGDSGGSARPPPAQPRRGGTVPSDCDGLSVVPAGRDDSSSTSENSEDEEKPGGQVPALAPDLSPPAVFDHPAHLFLPDAPIFTPTACDMYCSPSHFHCRCPDAGVSTFSPSVMEIMKTFHDH